MTLLLPVLAFLLVSALVGAGAMALTPGTSAIEQRLGDVMGEAARPVPATSTIRDMAMDWLGRLGAVAPRSTAEMGRLQQRLVPAGGPPRGAGCRVFWRPRRGADGPLFAFAGAADPPPRFFLW